MRGERTSCFATSPHQRGATLLDALVGTALMLVVFVGFVGAFRLTIMAVSNNKARAGAIALSNERLEFIRSLPYDSVGTVGGIPSGAIAQTETLTLNDVTYTRRTFISYEDDPADGLGGADSNGIQTDYKAAKATVSWTTRYGEHTITLVSRVSPPGIETAVPGGTLLFNVHNAALTSVSNAQIRIVNSTVSPAIDMTTYTDLTGVATVLGVPAGSGYQITVTKSGYSTAQTYSASSTNANPTPAHLGVALNQTTAATFGIDVLGTKTIQTFSPIRTGTTTETFASASNVNSSSELIIFDDVVSLYLNPEGYSPQGTILMNPVSTTTLAAWKMFSFEDSKPAGTQILYRIFDATGTNLIPEAQLPGNSAGFSVSPVNLSSISTSTYSALSVHATLSTTDASSTPTLDAYAIALESGPHPMGNIGLMVRGTKTIGTTGGGALVYKYQNSSVTTGNEGYVTLSGLEWDSYTTSLNASTTYDIASACYPQPESLEPGSTQTTSLFLVAHTAHSLLVDVKNGAGAIIPGASIQLTRGAYDRTQSSDGCGNTLFSNLTSGSVGSGNPYSINISASGYQTYSSTEVGVSGTTRLSIILNN